MTGRPMITLAVLALAGCAGQTGGGTVDEPLILGAAGRGAMMARDKCSGCHAVERSGESPMRAAPPFRTMGATYPVSDLQEAFAEGVVTAHPAMPAFELEPTEIADLIAWLETVSGTGPGL